MSVSPQSSRNDPNEFGTVAFYAALGRAFVIMCAFIPLLFLIELIDQGTGHHLDSGAGIAVRHASGLDGILFAPFLHASWAHLYSNSVPLLLTGTFVLASGTRRFLQVTALVVVTSGLSVWLFGPSNSVTIGASGVIFGYLGFLLMRGVVERTWWAIAVAALVGLLYGVVLAGVVPGDPHISWQDHLGGLLGGVVGAVVFRQPRAKPLKPAKELPTTATLPTLD